MLLYRVRLDEWRSGSLAFLCIMWILAGIGDPLPPLEDHSLAFGLVQDSPTSTDMTVTPTNSTATACETFVSDPTPTPTPLRRTSSHCLYPNRYYLGLESPAGLWWLQSPAITTMLGRSSTKKRVCLRKPRRAIPFCRFSVLPFCHSAVLLFCHSAILPFCYSEVLHVHIDAQMR